MTTETEKAELVDFEIVRDSQETVRVVSPRQMARFVLLGLAGLALFFIILGVGVMLLIPVLIFITIARLIGSTFSTRTQRR